MQFCVGRFMCVLRVLCSLLLLELLQQHSAKLIGPAALGSCGLLSEH